MRYILSTVLFLFALILHSSSSQAQNKTIQPKIMVIPLVPEGGDMKKLYDTSTTMRIAISKINEAFLKRGANMVSFDAKLKEAKDNLEMNRVAGNTPDYKAMVLQMSGADIYVSADIMLVKQARNLNSVTVVLNAQQTGTNNLLGTETGRSRMNQTEDIGLLCEQAMDGMSEGFLKMMELKFNDIHENGQSVFLQFTIAPGAEAGDFDHESGTPAKSLEQHIMDWLEENSVKGVFNSQGVVGNMMIISDMRIPLKQKANDKLNYTGSTLYADLNKFFKSIQVKIRREISNNNKILITIL